MRSPQPCTLPGDALLKEQRAELIHSISGPFSQSLMQVFDGQGFQLAELTEGLSMARHLTPNPFLEIEGEVLV